MTVSIKRMRAIIAVLLFALCLVFSCDLFTKNNGDEEPPYTVKIAWDSGLYSCSYRAHTVHEDNVYFYERPEGINSYGVYRLTKVNADTGSFVWRSLIFMNIVFCQPVVIGGYVYVFLQPNVIMCFDKETGEHTAMVKVNIDNKDLRISNYPTAYQNHIYLGLYWDSSYFVRLNISDINQNGDPENMQNVTPEILWEPALISSVGAKTVIHNNIVYTATNTGRYAPVEIAGFEVETKQMVFYKAFGGPEDGNVPFQEGGGTLQPRIYS